jgi:hypothetical protein
MSDPGERGRSAPSGYQLSWNHQDLKEAHMHAHNLSKHLVRKPIPSRFAVGTLVALTLLSAACNNDAASRINAPPSVSLTHSDDGSSSSGGNSGSGFTVLANTAVSCSGGSITGDVGTFQAPGDLPPGVVTLTTGCLVNGAVHVGDAAAKAAFNGFLSDYAALAPKAGDVCPIITGTLAGQTLAPGTYCVSSEAKTGTLTLSGPASGTWVIKVPSGALTGTSFSVVMGGNAQACNVTWWVDAATTMTTSAFQGNILSGAAITMTAGTANGNAWSKADVTFTEGTVITGCEGTRGSGNGGDKDKDKDHCNQGIGNGREGCDPGDSNHHNGSNDEGENKRGHSGRDNGRSGR